MSLLLVHSFSKLFIDTTTYRLIQYMICIAKVIFNIIITVTQNEILLYLISKEVFLNSEKSSDCETYTNPYLFPKSNSEDFN